MPGPNSQPWASRNGVRVTGKTALKRLRLHSGQGAYRDPAQSGRADQTAVAEGSRP